MHASTDRLDDLEADPDPSAAPRGPAGVPENDLRFYRILGFLSPVLIFLLGYIHRQADPATVDPLGERAAVAAYMAFVATASWFWRGRGYLWLVRSVYAVVTLWLIHLLVLNDLSPDYAFSLIVVIPAISAMFKDRRHLLLYLGLTLAAATIGISTVDAPAVGRTSPLLYIAELGLTAILSFVVVGGRIRSEQDLSRSRERYALAARGSRDGLWDLDLLDGGLHVSPRWGAMVGLHGRGRLPVTLQAWVDRVHPDDRADFVRAFDRGTPGSHFEVEYRMRHEDGGDVWMLCRGVVVRDASGDPVRMAGSQTDVTERKRAEERMLHDALHDSLTSLPNRVLFLDRVRARLRGLDRNPRRFFAVIVVDVDRFKVVNDSLGHAAGDTLLVEVGGRLEAAVRRGDTVARLGGDEFALLLDDVDGIDEVIRVAGRITEYFTLPFSIDGRETFAGVTLGITLSSAGYEMAEDMLRDADNAMHRAKDRAPGRYEIFDTAMHQEAVSLLDLETDLRRALERDELVAFYQPVVRLSDRKVLGFEALVRWQHPAEGLLPPSRFIPRAEETGLIVPIGELVLEKACRFIAGIRESDGMSPYVSVNLSARQFLQADLTETVEDVLTRTGVDPSRLILEITETVIMEDPEVTRRTLHRLGEMGVKASIDDFGTGYSSLSYLHEFPVGVLKIDQSFVQRIDDDARAEAIVRTMVGLGESLGMGIVAEGVERAPQLDRIERLGCHFVQGNVFAPAMDPAALLGMIEDDGTGPVLRPLDALASGGIGRTPPTQG